MWMLAMKKLLLKDYIGPVGDSKLLTEADISNIKNGALIIAGLVQEAEVLNHNNRIYTKSTLLREVSNYQKLIKARRAIGECDHPDRPIIEWRDVSHLFSELWWEGNKVYAKIEILKEFPRGQVLAAAHYHQIPIGMSSRGLGSVEKVRGKNYVSEDYQIICWDAVTDPSTPNAFADKTLSENDMRLFHSFDDKRFDFSQEVKETSLLEELLAQNNSNRTSIDINWRF